MTLALLSALLLLSVGGCGKDEVSHYQADQYPRKLSDWGLIKQQGNSLSVHPDTVVYALNTALFSDYAQKLRTVYIPRGKRRLITLWTRLTFQPAVSLLKPSFTL